MSVKQTINGGDFPRLIQLAEDQPRHRMNKNFHFSYEDQVQRFLNVLLKGSYVRPHFHVAPNAWEGFIAIQGQLGVYTFNEEGVLINKQRLSCDGPDFGLEIDSTQMHCIAALTESAVVFEYKSGPYDPDDDKRFAQWAPAEEDASAIQFMSWLVQAEQGQCYGG